MGPEAPGQSGKHAAGLPRVAAEAGKAASRPEAGVRRAHLAAVHLADQLRRGVHAGGVWPGGARGGAAGPVAGAHGAVEPKAERPGEDRKFRAPREENSPGYQVATRALRLLRNR